MSKQDLIARNAHRSRIRFLVEDRSLMLSASDQLYPEYIVRSSPPNPRLDVILACCQEGNRPPIFTKQEVQNLNANSTAPPAVSADEQRALEIRRYVNQHMLSAVL